MSSQVPRWFLGLGSSFQKFVEPFMPSLHFPCEAAGCVQGPTNVWAPPGLREPPFCCPIPQKPLTSWDRGRGGTGRAGFAEYLPKSTPSSSMAQLLVPCRGAAALLLKSRASLSHPHAPLADDTLDVLHYNQRLQHCCLASFHNPEM